MILSNIQLRNILLIIYMSFSVPYSIYKFYTKNISSVISKSGHLKWNFFNPVPALLAWLFFFLFSFFYEKMWKAIIFGLSTLLIAFVNYQKDDTYTSMWCWLSNTSMLYFSCYLLLYLPFLEKNSIC